jgi:hypothetical protein
MKFTPNDNRIVCKIINGKQLQYRIVLDETGEHTKIEYI